MGPKQLDSDKRTAQTAAAFAALDTSRAPQAPRRLLLDKTPLSTDGHLKCAAPCKQEVVRISCWRNLQTASAGMNLVT